LSGQKVYKPVKLGYVDHVINYVSKQTVFSKAGHNVMAKPKSGYQLIHNAHTRESKLFTKALSSDQNALTELIFNFNNSLEGLVSSGHNEDYKGDSTFIKNYVVINKHVVLWDYMLELDLNIDNKIYMKNLARRLLLTLKDNLTVDGINFELFNSTSLNKAYIRCFKVIGIFLMYLTFLMTDFNYDNTVRQQMKKILSNLTNFLIQMIESNVLNPDNCINNRNFIERFKKAHKHHQYKKGKDFSSMLKILEVAISTIKQFSKYKYLLIHSNYFKFGYFKSVHNIATDLFRTIDSQSIVAMYKVIINNVLFYSLSSSDVSSNSFNLIGIIRLY
jgi:hypothetical protein